MFICSQLSPPIFTAICQSHPVLTDDEAGFRISINQILRTTLIHLLMWPTSWVGDGVEFNDPHGGNLYSQSLD